MNKQKVIKNLLKKFFELFQANIVEISFNESVITGTIIWNDSQEFQEFIWRIPQENPDYKIVIQLINYFIQKKIIDGDKIILPKKVLIQELIKLETDLKKVEDSLNFLCSIRISMIDKGEITDYFFIHF